jgi:hypothetical protein
MHNFTVDSIAFLCYYEVWLELPRIIPTAKVCPDGGPAILARTIEQDHQ